MEITFIANDKLYRIDGNEPKDQSMFWAEELDNELQGTDNYECFSLKDLLEAQKDSLVQALTNTVYVEYAPQPPASSIKNQLSHFLELLKKSNLPTPDVLGEEPDSHMSMEWYKNPRHIISVSLSKEGMLYWAALFGRESFKGSEQLKDEVPTSLTNLIYKFLGFPEELTETKQ